MILESKQFKDLIVKMFGNQLILLQKYHKGFRKIFQRYQIDSENSITIEV